METPKYSVDAGLYFEVDSKFDVNKAKSIVSKAINEVSEKMFWTNRNHAHVRPNIFNLKVDHPVPCRLTLRLDIYQDKVSSEELQAYDKYVSTLGEELAKLLKKGEINEVIYFVVSRKGSTFVTK